jgi:hypothetical protein
LDASFIKLEKNVNVVIESQKAQIEKKLGLIRQN